MGTGIYLYDSLRAEQVEVNPVKPGEVSIYYCGPTVYNYVHLGNVRPVVVFDVLTRVIKAKGLEPKVVSNYTDIDDKIIAEALKEKKTEKEISQFYIDAYEACLAPLHLLPLFYHPRASETIQKMQDFIQVLLDRGYAYRSGDDVYFSVEKIADYGAISHIKVDENQAGKRVETLDTKRDPRDFALWKLTSDQGIKFPSPFGAGRPGWHTECVTMIKTVFKQPVIDIHGGGFDLKFPHHENERAQSIGYDGTPLAHLWMYVGFLTAAKGEKMSKSLGNVVLAKDLLAQHSGNALRLFFYRSHYRAPIAYSEEAIEESEQTASRYVATMRRLQARLALAGAPVDPDRKNEAACAQALDFLCHDLNIANALTVVEGAVKTALTQLRSARTPLDQIAESAGTLSYLYNLLGIYTEPFKLTDDDKKLVAQYERARQERDFATSDLLRPKLIERGLI